ncbi:MAG: rhamnulokinase [Planctomycetaceae bacterium]|nr:rhamnulokinase [Planctomycetaceae bacterium]
MKHKTYLAVDAGASSGRLMAGHFDGEKLQIEEIYRFENGPVDIAGTLYWNLPSLWTHIKTGLQIAGAKFGSSIVSAGVDTWGVDFGFLGKDGQLLANPVCYRDARTDGIMEKAFQKVSRRTIFQQTGLQFMQFNSLYQLLAMQQNQSPLLDVAGTFLMMPDLFHYLLSGEKSNELTNASTTQFYDPTAGNWATSMLKSFGLPTGFLQPVSPAGTILGFLRKELAETTGLTSAKVILPGSHDTASAVLSVPAKPDATWAYISLGTWALMGIESPNPLINSTVEELNFTNEGGVAGTTRILKNITGMWLLQECRRVWNEHRTEPLSWDDITALTESAAPLRSFINPDHRDFLTPTDMPKAVAEFCRRSGQPVPENEGAVLRCALDSIAMKFRHVLEMCEKITDTWIETVHIVGGGTKNKLLCQAAANACRRRVVAGPVEATAAGNIMMQAIALGDAADISEARQIIQKSFEVTEYLPQNPAEWHDAYERFLKSS